MKKEWADKWVAALRSGNYVQGQRSLRQRNLHTVDAVPSFCCLGVLCDLAKDEPEVQGTWETKGFVCASGAKSNASLPSPVQKVAGMLSPEGDFQEIEGYETWPLIDLNDRQGKSFEEIAKIIEEHWEQL